jgi:hypothetical protein
MVMCLVDSYQVGSATFSRFLGAAPKNGGDKPFRWGFGSRLEPEEKRKMATFEVHGPFELDFEKRKGGRVLAFDKFWSEESAAHYLSSEKGCYVFAIRNRTLTPIYVGKATKTFKTRDVQ